MAKHTETPRSGHPIEALLCSLRDDLAAGADLPAWSMDAETTTRVVQLAAQVVQTLGLIRDSEFNARLRSSPLTQHLPRATPAPTDSQI